MPHPHRITAPRGNTLRLRIEPLASEHVSALVDPLLDPTVYQWIPPHPDEASFRTYCESLIAGPGERFPDQTWWNLAVFHRATAAGVGRLEATCIGHQVEIAYLLGSRWWHQGLGGEAVDWLVEQIRSHFPGSEIWATVHPDNRASLLLLQRHGFAQTHDFPDTLRSYDPGDAVYRYCAANG